MIYFLIHSIYKLANLHIQSFKKVTLLIPVRLIPMSKTVETMTDSVFLCLEFNSSVTTMETSQKFNVLLNKYH